LYATSSPASSCAGVSSSNFFTRNCFTCSRLRTSSFGGVLNFNPVAASMRGIAFAISRPYGP
jgi:hypothetical protein